LHILGLFNNPVGYQTSLAVFQAKACEPLVRQNRIFSGTCSETEVSEQLYSRIRNHKGEKGKKDDYA
jgi:hypothetical protein